MGSILKGNISVNSKETEIMPFNVVMLGRKHRVKQ
jgi:hypothetical protein